MECYSQGTSYQLLVIHSGTPHKIGNMESDITFLKQCVTVLKNASKTSAAMVSPQTISRDNEEGGNYITSHDANPEEESRDKIKLLVCTDSGKLLKPRLFWTLK